MKGWFTTLSGAIVFSAVALLSELWRGFLDAMFVFPGEIGDESYMHLGALIYTIVFAGWVWSLISAARGSRRGLVAAFIINGLVWLLIPVGTLLSFCPLDCLVEGGWIWVLVNTLNLLLGLLAAIALGLRLRHTDEVALNTDQAP